MDEAENTDGVASRPGVGARSRRLPPATLDLTATPIRETAGAPAPADDEMSPPSVSAEQHAPDTIPAPQPAEPPVSPMNSLDPAENPSDVPPSNQSSRAWAWAAGGITATAIVLLAVLAVTRPWDFAISPSAESPQLAERLARIEAQVAELAQRPAPVAADASRTAALDQRLAAIESKLREVANRPAVTGGDPNQAVAVSKRLDDLTKRLDAAEPAGMRLDEITSRLTRLEAAVAVPRPQVADPAVAQRLGAIETAVKTIGDRVADMGRRVDDIAVTARDADRHAETATAVAAAPSAADQAMRLAFLATALRSAAERGVSFSSELAALKPVVPDKARLAALEPFAATGVPSEAALSRELSTILPALTAATTPPVSEGSLIDRLHLTTQHLVRIRRVGEVAGDDAAAVVARIDAKTAHNDVAGALAELAKLLPAVRAPVEAWIAKATQRTAALDAAQALAGDALAGLKSAP